ncbi:MAG: hypothetical protein IKB70_10250 [Bacilli bacterium]|nr:hypothetical protein [Bacilli bacterium]
MLSLRNKKVVCFLQSYPFYAKQFDLNKRYNFEILFAFFSRIEHEMTLIFKVFDDKSDAVYHFLERVDTRSAKFANLCIHMYETHLVANQILAVCEDAFMEVKGNTLIEYIKGTPHINLNSAVVTTYAHNPLNRMLKNSIRNVSQDDWE